MTSASNATYWHDTYQQHAAAVDEFFGELLDLLPGAEDEGMDAYDQIPRGIKALTADRDQLRSQLTEATDIVERALRHGYDIGGIELDDLARSLGITSEETGQ